MVVSRETVIQQFQQILGREPESERVIAQHMALQDEQTLKAVLLGSAEYALRKERLGKTVNETEPLIASAAPSQLQLTLIGNCQVRVLGNQFQAMLDNAQIHWHEVGGSVIQKIEAGQLDAQLKSSDLVFIHSHAQLQPLLLSRMPQLKSRLRLIPRITFSAFHPDMDYIHLRQPVTWIKGAMDDYHSALIFYAWRTGLPPAEVAKLFSDEIFDALGYFDYWPSGIESLLEEEKLTGINLEPLIDRWTKHGAWMHSLNHPRSFVLADVAQALLDREGFQATPALADLVHDYLADGPVWPVYPSIAARLGITGHYRFKPVRIAGNPPPYALNLEEFIEASYRIYNSYRKDDLHCNRLDTPRYRDLATLIARHTSLQRSPSSASEKYAARAIHPYAQLPDHQFWRRAVEQPNAEDVDPVVHSSLAIKPTDKVATAGSCFAQHISRTLERSGFRYFVTEDGQGLPANEAEQRQFGTFSARFGNLYTARQLVQLFDRAHGAFSPVETAWQRKDGRWVDPFRPQIEPDGFADPAAVAAARDVHLAAVRRMFKELDILVFTLGLTEAWRSKQDGAVYPLAPGVAGGSLDPDRHAFVNFGVNEVQADLSAFARRLRAVNPSARVVLTVSPVPLIATYEKRHVLVSTTHSKAVLRAAAHEICASEPSWEYFPSYEIITGPHAKGAYYEEDKRSVRPEGVAHVMRLFLRHCAVSGVPPATAALAITQPDSTIDGNATTALRAELRNQNALRREIVCDEEALDLGSTPTQQR